LPFSLLYSSFSINYIYISSKGSEFENFIDFAKYRPKKSYCIEDINLINWLSLFVVITNLFLELDDCISYFCDY